MTYQAEISRTARLLADGARASMVSALLDGRALPAGELARIAGVSAQTASSHLAQLVDGGLLVARAQGRHRYFAIAGAEIAHALETLSAMTPPPAVRSLSQSIDARRLGAARTCYDHLAGALAVDIADALVARGDVVRHDAGFEVTPRGRVFFAAEAIDAPHFTRSCIDWTQRRQHVSGALGRAMLERFLERGYLRRARAHRSITVTPDGSDYFLRSFEVVAAPNPSTAT